MNISALSAVEHALRCEHGGKRVLLAEDHQLNREVMTEILRNVGLGVDAAANEIQAVAVAAGNPYNVILMHLKIPGMDGLCPPP